MSEAKAAYYPVSLRPGADLDEQLATRGDSAAATMKRDLMRYYRLCRAELERIRFTQTEVFALLETDAIGHLATNADGALAGPLWALLDEAIEHGFTEAGTRVNRTEFVQKLRRLSPGGVAAIVDAIERFRRHPRPIRHRDDRIRIMRAVGFRLIEDETTDDD